MRAYKEDKSLFSVHNLPSVGESVTSGFEKGDGVAITQRTSLENSSKITIPNGPSLKEQLFANRNNLKIMAARYTMEYISPDFRKQLFNQLDWLFDPEGWEKDYVLAKPDSFKTLIKFILNTKPYAAPHLGLSDDGNMLASWRKDSNKLMLECWPDESTKWFVSCVFEEKLERASGEAPSLRRLLAALSPYRNAGWYE